MKKEEEKSKNSTLKGSTKKLITYGAFIATIILILVIGYFLILPGFNNLDKSNKEVELEKAKHARLQQTVQTLASQDKGTLDQLSELLNNLVPEEIDMLHFAALNEVVARSVGANITNIEAKKTIVQPAAPVGTTGGSGTIPSAAIPTQTAPTTISITYLSNFETLVSLVKAWGSADQFVGVNQVTITASNDGIITYTIIYDLLTSGASGKATIDDTAVLTSEQKEDLTKLKEKIIYTATPSANPVGRANPFQ